MILTVQQFLEQLAIAEPQAAITFNDGGNMTNAIAKPKVLKTPLKKLEQVRRWRANNVERARGIAAKVVSKMPKRVVNERRHGTYKNHERALAYMANKRKNNPRGVASDKLKAAFGITLEQYEAIAQGQGHACAICGTPQTEQLRKMAVDHNHTTGTVRSLLCHNCNVGLGNFKDNPNILTKAIKYLYDHNRNDETQSKTATPVGVGDDGVPTER